MPSAVVAVCRLVRNEGAERRGKVNFRRYCLVRAGLLQLEKSRIKLLEIAADARLLFHAKQPMKKRHLFLARLKFIGGIYHGCF
jgi:hypothetical protein